MVLLSAKMFLLTVQIIPNLTGKKADKKVIKGRPEIWHKRQFSVYDPSQFPGNSVFIPFVSVMGCIFYATTVISYFLMFVGRNEQTSKRKCSIFRLRGKLESINKEADKNSHGHWPYCLCKRLTDSSIGSLTNIHPNFPRGCSF